MTARPTRRALLAGSLGTLLTACTRRSSRPHGPAATTAVDPDVALRAAAVAREQALIAAYDRVPSTPALAVLRAEHVTHLQSLTPAGLPPTPTPLSSPKGGGRPATVSRLAALERRAAAEHAAGAVTASLTLAPVLASLAASEASHAAVL